MGADVKTFTGSMTKQHYAKLVAKFRRGGAEFGEFLPMYTGDGSEYGPRQALQGHGFNLDGTKQQ